MRNILDPSGKHRRRFVTWMLLASSGVVPVLAILAIHALRDRIEQAHHAQIALAHILADSNELEAKEYKAFASEKLDANQSEKIESYIAKVSLAINELIRLHPANPQLQEVSRAYETYTRNMREEFRLLTAGKVAAAKTQDDESVVPVFSVLHKSIEDADPAFSTAADRTAQFVEVGSAAVTLFACVMMGLLFWRLRAVQSVVIDQTSLRAANEMLRNEVVERKRAEESLQLQSAALNAAANAVVITDQKGNILWVNSAFTSLTGYTREEAIGQNPRILKSGKQDEKLYADLWKTVTSNQVWQGEIVNRRKNGSLYTEEMTITPVRNSCGVISRFIAIKQDVTHRSKAEEALRRSEGRYRNLFETMREGFALCEIICDNAGKPCNFRYLEVNAAFEEILGVKRGEALNKTVRELFPQVESSWIDIYGKVALTGAPANFENYLGALDKHFEVAAFSPKPGQFAAIFMDITKRKRADEKLQESNLRLQDTLDDLKTAQEQVIQQERLHAIGTMASGIAHDFNNSLAAILGYSELLLHRPGFLDDKEKARNYIEMMNTAAQDAGKVVNRLREFYRYREETEVFALVDINQLVNEAVALTQPKWKAEAEAHGVSIEVGTDLPSIPPVAANAANIREALTNLIFNAVDAMPRGGTVTIRTHHDDGHVVLEVADTGTGMTEEVRRHCLEPFFSTKGERGTGLGLSMVYGIVQRHEGTIDIQSAVGKGTSFIISLPHRATKSQVPQREEQTTKPARSLRILVVDDEPMVRKIIGEYLKVDGHIVEIANGGRAGLEKFRSGLFDLVLVDRAMPDMSGDQVASAIKSASPTMPVVMLTGFGAMMDAADEKPADVDLVIAKPVTIAGLRLALAKVTTPGTQDAIVPQDALATDGC